MTERLREMHLHRKNRNMGFENKCVGDVAQYQSVLLLSVGMFLTTAAIQLFTPMKSGYHLSFSSLRPLPQYLL